MIDINELRRLTQAATPGPWLLRTAPTSAGLCHTISAADWRGAFIYGDGLRIGVDDSLPKAQELAANAHLIAAANPTVISELLDRLEAAEKECNALRAKIEAMEKQEPYSYIYEYANPIDGSPVWRDTPGYWNAQYPRSSKPLYAIPDAQPAPSVPKLHVGNLPTINQDDYPALGAWWVQLWDGDSVLARVYGASPEEAHNRALMLAAAPEAKP